VAEMAMLCQEILSSKTAEEMDFDRKEAIRLRYPSMYYQMYDDCLPLNERDTKKAAKIKAGKRGFVYLAMAEGTKRWKIGRTQKLKERGTALNKQSPFPLIIEHVIQSDDYEAMEALLHEKYKACRVHGEWFELTASQVGEIKLF